MFNEVGAKVVEKDQSGRPSRVTVNLKKKKKVEQKFVRTAVFPGTLHNFSP